MSAYDVIVLGGGPAGLACAYALAAGGKRVAIVERELVGGECAYWACVPTKALLRAAAPNAESAVVPGSREARAGVPAFAPAAAWRTSLVSDYDDGDHVRELETARIVLLRGEASIVRRGCVRLDDRELTCETIVVATGSTDTPPPLEGLRDGGAFWMSRDASAATSVPASLIVLGGGAVGVEFAQLFARFGSRVTLVEPSSHVLPSEDADAAGLLAAQLVRDGVDVRTGKKPERVTWHDDGVSVHLPGGETLVAARVAALTGRSPNSADIGLENAGVACDDRGAIRVDETCRAADGVFAVGDVTNVAPYTHAAKYQGRIAAATILGSHARARYDAVPRCVYTSPEVASVGTTRATADESGAGVLSARVDFDEVTRPVLHSDPPADGALELFADPETGALVGGWIVGPFASESIGFVTSAIVARTPLATLLDVIQPYPTYGEAFYVALDRLARSLTASRSEALSVR